MARFSKTELNDYIDESLTTGFGAGKGLSALQVADIVATTMKECLRHLPNVSSATGTMFEIGSNEDNWFELVLLEEGEAGSLSLPNEDPSGFQLIPIVTGNDTSENWPSPSGQAFNSPAFDGVEEVFLGTGATANMFKIDYDGKWDVVASCKPAPDGNQNNREVETDLWVFDGAGQPKRSIGFIASANQGSNGRTFTQSIPRSTLNEAFLGDDEWVGLVARKYAGEGSTTVKLQKAFIQVTLSALGD